MSKKKPQYEYNSSNNIVIVPTVSFLKGPTPENNVPQVENTKPINTDAKAETFKIPCLIRNNNICESVVNQDFNLNPTSGVLLFNNYCPVNFLPNSSQFQSINNIEWEYHNTPSTSSFHTNYCCTWNTPLPTYNTEHTRDVVLDQTFTSTVYNIVQSIDTMPLDSIHLPTQSHQPAATKNLQLLHEHAKSIPVKTTPTCLDTNERKNKMPLKTIKPANEKSLHEKDAEQLPKKYKIEDREKSKKKRTARKSRSDSTNDSPIKTKSKSISIISPAKIHYSTEENCSLKPSKSDNSSKQIVCEGCGVKQKTIDKREELKKFSGQKSKSFNKIKKLSVELQKVKKEINKRKRELIIKEVLIQKEQQAINRAEQHKHTNGNEDKEMRANHLDKLTTSKNKINKTDQDDLKESSRLSKTIKKADATGVLISKIKEIKNKYNILKTTAAAEKFSSKFQENNTPAHMKSVLNVTEQYSWNNTATQNKTIKLQENNTPVHMKRVVNVAEPYSLNNTVKQKKTIAYHTDKTSIFQNRHTKHITRTIEQSKEKSQTQEGNKSIAKCNIRYINKNKFEGDHDDLVVMFNNENRKNEEQLRERKVQRKRKREDKSQKPVYCKKIKNIEFIINVVTEDSKPTAECEIAGDETDFKEDTSAGVDLSFLDDINVDEIAEYLKVSHDITKIDDNKTLESDFLEDVSLNHIPKTNDAEELSPRSVFVTHFESDTTQSNDKARNIITQTENSSDTGTIYTETLKVVEKKQQEYNDIKVNHENEFDVELLMEQLFSDNAKQPPHAAPRNIMYANEKPVDVYRQSISLELDMKENESKLSRDKLKTSEISKQVFLGDSSSSEFDEFHMQTLKKTYEAEKDKASAKYISNNEINIWKPLTKFISEGNKKYDKVNEKSQKKNPGINQTFKYCGNETREKSEVTKYNPYIDHKVHLAVAEPRNAGSKGSDDSSQKILHKISKENENEILIKHNCTNVISMLGTQTDIMKYDKYKEGVKDSDLNPQPAGSSVTATRRNENKYFSQNSQIMFQDNAVTDNEGYKEFQKHSFEKMSKEEHQQNSIAYNFTGEVNVAQIMQTTSSITGKKEKHEDTEDDQIISEILEPLETESQNYLNKTRSIPNNAGTTIETADIIVITDEANTLNEAIIPQKEAQKVDLLQRTGKKIDNSDVKIIEPILRTFDLTKEPDYLIHRTGKENDNSDVKIIEPIPKTVDLTKQPVDLIYRTNEGNCNSDVKIIEPILETIDLTKEPANLLRRIGEKNYNSNVKIIEPILETVDMTKEWCALKVSSLDSSSSLCISSASSNSFDEASVLDIHIGCAEMANLNIIDSVLNDNSDSKTGNNFTIPEIKSAPDAETKGKTKPILSNDSSNFSQATVRNVNTNQHKEDRTFKNKADICEKGVIEDIQKIDKVISTNDAEKAFPLKFRSVDPRKRTTKQPCGVPLVRNMTERIFEYMHIKYIVNSIIHNGTYSQIFKCQDNSGNVIAAKVSKIDDAVTGYEREQMLMKAQDSIPREKLSCVYLINGLAVELKWCYLLEYYPKNLEQALKERGKSFHVDTVLHFARQLVSAVVILRNNNIVHSDIKPSHILMDPNNRQLKLCGFDTAYYKKHMQLTGVVGTIHYRAPEAILGHSEGHSIDVWATALVLHEMATFQKLFPGSTNNEVLYQQMCVLGNIPLLMVQQSEFKDIYFQGNRFLRKEPFEKISMFAKSAKVSTSVSEAYYLNWYRERNIIERRRDFARQRDFCNLLNQMLVMDPANRLTIEFVYADPLIYS